jgi:hypothetical protein
LEIAVNLSFKLSLGCKHNLEIWSKYHSSEINNKSSVITVVRLNFEAQPEQLEVEYSDVPMRVIEELLDNPVGTD